jgi:hypothetical protein
MKQVMRAVSVTAMLLGAANAVAGETQVEQEDALQEAWDNAAIESLMASTALAPAEPADEDSEVSDSTGAVPANEYTEAQALELLRTGEPENFGWLAGPPLQLRGCWYFILTPPTPGYGPPRYRLTVQRMPSRHCEARTVVLDSSYTSGATVTHKESKGIAIAFPSKQTPSGSALVHVRLFAVDPKSLAVDRYGFLGTYRGSTWAHAMHFEGNRLIVETNRYTATFPRFLTSEEPPLGVIFP